MIKRELSGQMEQLMNRNLNAGMAMLEGIKSLQTFWTGIFRYTNTFMEPAWPASRCFYEVEKQKILTTSPLENYFDYVSLFQMNLGLMTEGAAGAFKTMGDLNFPEAQTAFMSFIDAFSDPNGEKLLRLLKQGSSALETLVHHYPKAIKAAKKDFGVHPERGDVTLVAETQRFYLYRVTPSVKNIKLGNTGKPVLVIPPYVLGSNILMFLRGKKKSYVNAFADQGIPTYLRVLKTVSNTPAVQEMAPEDDCMDMAYFLSEIKKIHNKKVTLNGYCQGGFVALINLLSGRLDNLVDALVTCVSPIDGTKSISLKNYYTLLPDRFRDMGHSVKTLDTGHKVVDGEVMSWVYKIMSMGKESPVAAFYRDLSMFLMQKGKIKINTTAAALNYWLAYERTDIPKKICDFSFITYNKSISDDGTLPVTLFGRKLNFSHLKKTNIQYHISIAEQDDLVDGDCAKAPLNHVDAELCVFPKGHLGIATSWSHPESACALHTRFGKNYRGPVRFHLDLES
ncbi:MAG: metal transporter [Proteobacteria bacterium]|nr:metal transporter [Pseudomonadota bacterium]MBU1583357.1 metal transporter [Pseudomonadota bacterium]MBU2453141.1 metal transporter [Pseudomonadota bacterium]MBU2627843.1 metal transporter [Pseudomonadota bacterium]